ncbi:unnamed protein product [Colias eurytheme]|nr:unnamed protein product [Colias eurytheme]
MATTKINVKKQAYQHKRVYPTDLDIMRTTQITQYALRLTYSQPASREKMVSRSALALAAIGLGVSTFSVRQMILSQSRRF